MKAIGKWIKRATRQVFDPDHEERIKELSAILYKNMQTAGDQFSLLHFKQQCDYTERDIELAKHRIYQTLLARAWQDDKVTEGEHKTLNWVISRLHIPQREARDLQLLTARDRFAAALARAMDDGTLNEAEASHLEQISRSVGVSLGDFVRTYFRTEGEDFLRGIFAACTEGGVLADDAWARLGSATKRLGLSKRDLLSTVQVQAERFVEHVLADAKSDGQLSEKEEAVLMQLIQTLELNSESTAYVKKSISALRAIRDARQGKLPTLNRPIGVTIRSGEIVHYHAPAMWQQKRILRSGEHWDQHSGAVTITDYRVLFTSDTRSFDVKFGKILSHWGTTGFIRLKRSEKPESCIRVSEDEPMAYAIFEGAVALATQTRLAKTDGNSSRHIPRDVRQRVWQRYGGQCAECGAKHYLEFDHVIPVAKGGSNTDANVQLGGVLTLFPRHECRAIIEGKRRKRSSVPGRDYQTIWLFFCPTCPPNAKKCWPASSTIRKLRPKFQSPATAAIGFVLPHVSDHAMPPIRHDPERIIDLDLVRCTENAALAAWKYFGKGDKTQADAAASDAMRGMFGLIDCKGLVRIGEGRKDDAPGIFEDERLGTWRDGAIPAAIAIDPIDGTTLTAKGLPGAISVLAASTCASPNDDPHDLFPSIASHYMEKIAVGQAVAESDVRVQIDAPLEANLSIIAGQLQKRLRDLVVVVLDRPRHQAIIETLRSVGCRVRLISDGDVAAAIAPSLPDSGVDAYVGIGGSPEGVISAAAIKCLGGQQLCRMWPKDAAERQQLLEDNLCTEADLRKVWTVEMMAPGNHLIFAATGISDSPMLPGIVYRGQHCVTHSILMRARNRTVRRIQAYHDLARKTIRMHSTGQEMPL